MKVNEPNAKIWAYVDADDVAQVLQVIHASDFAGEWKSLMDEEGRTLLHRACERGSEKVGEELLRQGALLNMPTRNPHAETALHTALRVGPETAFELVRTLVVAGAELNAGDSLGRTPLHLAVERQVEEWIRFLVAAGADPLLKSGARRSVIETARDVGRPDFVVILRSLPEPE